MRGQLRSRASGTWEIRVELGRDPRTGKRLRSARTIRGTKRLAERVLAAMMADVNTGAYQELTRETVGAYLLRWLDGARLRDSTRLRYRFAIDKYLIPDLGHLRLDQLRAEHYMAAEARWRGIGHSKATLLQQYAILHRALRQAVKWKLLLASPLDAVDRPRPDLYEYVVLDERQLAVLLERIARSPYRVVYLLMAYLGLRAGEALGLRWRDLTSDLRTARIRQAWSTRLRQFEDTKSHRSRRPIDIPEDLIGVLQRHSADQRTARSAARTLWQDHDLVAADPIGRPFNYDTVYHAFKRVLAEAGLPIRTRPHDLRHAMATHMLDAGENILVIQERLGHASPAFTLRQYGHLLPGVQRGAAERYAARLRPASAHNLPTNRDSVSERGA